ncbi:unnamed protein product [Rhizoctonia solani]|uniref:Uncharacterized protein n=1 Tax=Rhizoctonia solani TaxID=456999 RepID=A0A8H3CPY5_9AGAM|nr:unnamed protein product [Rhizoctonia solani]CAE6513271.1 unnamed protein product [Rhizoctonia solani]
MSSAKRSSVQYIGSENSFIDVDPDSDCDYDVVILSSDEDNGAEPDARQTPPPLHQSPEPPRPSTPTIDDGDEEELRLVDQTDMKSMCDGAVAALNAKFHMQRETLEENHKAVVATNVNRLKRDHDVFRGSSPDPDSPRAKERKELIDLEKRAAKCRRKHQLKELQQQQARDVGNLKWTYGLRSLADPDD